MEKNNDDARKIIQRKSNHTDDPAEVLRAEHRIRALKHRERKPRQYTKKNTEYWEINIKTNRRLRKRISYDKSPEAIPSEVPITTEPLPQQNKRGKRKQPRCTSKTKGKKQAKRAKKQ